MAGETVLVGTKMPTGIALNLDTTLWMNKDQVGASPVTRVVKSKHPEVTLKGTAYKQGIEPPPITIDGFVFTSVPKDFWDEWLATHADFGPLLDGYIIAAPTKDAASKMAREQEKNLGHNPRLVESDPRVRGTGAKTYDPQSEAA